MTLKKIKQSFRKTYIIKTVVIWLHYCVICNVKKICTADFCFVLMAITAMKIEEYTFLQLFIVLHQKSGF